MRHRNAIAVAVLLVSAGLCLAPAADRTDEPAGEIRLFKLKHVDTKTAVTVLRTLLNTRIVTEIPDQHTVIIRDDAETVARAADILKQVDVARPRWVAELVVGSGKREQILREIDLAGSHVVVRFTEGDGQHVGVQLDCRPSGAEAIDADYEMSLNLEVHAADTLQFMESGRARLGTGDSLSIFRPATDAQRQALGRILGLEGEADGLAVRFKLRP